MMMRSGALHSAHTSPSLHMCCANTLRRQGTTAFPLVGLSDAARSGKMAAADHQGREGGREEGSGGCGGWGGKGRLDRAMQLAWTQSYVLNE